MPPERDAKQPIAIIGMGMRLPGKVSTAEDFWKLLVSKENPRCRVPESRYNVDGFYGPQSHKEGVATEHGYFLEDVNFKAYDASFFGGTSSESQTADPQQRLLLQVVWECIENAGATSLRGSNTGVYVGCYGEDWNQLVHQDIQSSSVYRVLNTSDFILSNRISYQYDLRGPSLTIRTACSAAMTGLHLACQALYDGECPAAIVAGSSFILSPSMTQDMSAQGVLSPSGLCKTFDEAADGYARAEGVSAILIKPLEDALRDGDPIRAVIRSTAINSDGKTSNIGVPSVERQVALIRDAYRRAGIDDLSQTPFVECHGTGTAVGDPLEVTAVANAFGDAGTYIGSVKSNIGHTEGASGITSLIKAVLALENEMIPPNLNFSVPNPKIPFAKFNLKVPVEAIPWPKDRHARVSINCFGIGGANAHVILDSAASFGITQQALPARANCINGCGTAQQTLPTRANGINGSTAMNGTCSTNGSTAINGTSTNGTSHAAATSNGSRQEAPVLIPISASNALSLKARVEDMQSYIQSRPGSLAAIAHTLGSRRRHLAHRTFCVLDAASRGQAPEPEFYPFQTANDSPPEVAFVFTGQGAQWAGMAKELCQQIASFRQDVCEMDAALQQLPEPPRWTIQGRLLLADQESADRAAIAQPLSTAVQIALANLLIKYGVKPCAAVGHSSGEIAAAYVAGSLTMSEAIVCSYLRGLAIERQKSPRKGCMAAVGMSQERASSYLIEGVQVACVNSPSSVTLSGDADAVQQVMESIKSQDAEAFVRKLRVDVAYHSVHMRQVAIDYEELLMPHLSPKEANLPFYSTVFGRRLGSTSALTLGSAEYWRNNLESCVLFDSAIDALLGDLGDKPILLEIGPHSALRGPLRQIFQAQATSSNIPAYLPTLLRDESDLKSTLTAIGHLYSRGCKIDFPSVSPATPVLVDLPLYPWDLSVERWKESRISLAWRSRPHPHHELLGSSCPETMRSSFLTWRNVIGLYDVPWLKDHMIIKDVVFPCAAYIAMIGEAVRQTTGSTGYSIRDLVMKSAMVLREAETLEIITTMNPLRLTDFNQSSWYELSISSFNGTSWVEHCVAQGRASTTSTLAYPVKGAIESALPRQIAENTVYDRMKQMGLNFGSRFRNLTGISAHIEKRAARATIRSGEGDAVEEAGYAMHPCQIDACLQLSAVATSSGVIRHMQSLQVPCRIGSLSIYPHERSELVAEAAVPEESESSPIRRVDIVATTRDGQTAMHLSDLRFIRLDTGESDSQETLKGQTLARVEWRPHVDFCNVKDMLRQGVPMRHFKQGMEKVTALCILQFLDAVKSIASVPDGHLGKYISWLEKEKDSMLQGHYVLVPEAKLWATLDGPSREMLLESAVAHVDSFDHEAISGIVKMQTVIAAPDAIQAMFSGDTHPLQLLTEGTGLMEFYNYYSQCLNAKDFFQLSAHAQPNLKIIEIGGGTAGTTQVILNHLKSSRGTRMYSTYVFTDISSGFFASARERLSGWDGVEYQKLDITKNPAEQGFSLGEYDIVVASNVLHATPSLHETLTNVRALLKPGGRLYLQELVTPTNLRVVPYITGLLSGWWAGGEDGRADEPIVSIERWDQELRAAGFEGIEAAVPDDDNPLYATIAHITSVVPVPKEPEREITLLHNGEKFEFAHLLAASLESDGHRVYWRNLCDLQGVQDQVQGQDVIAVIDVEQPFFQDISKQSYASFMAYISQLKEHGVLWLTRSAQIHCSNPAYGLVLGLARTMRMEMSLDFWTAELQHLDPATVDATACIARRFLARPRGLGASVDCEFAVHNGIVHVGRYDWSPIVADLLPTLAEDDPKELAVARLGMLDSLHWVQRASPVLQEDEIEVSMRCTGLNFRDIMVAMGVLRGVKDSNGYEGAGVVSRIGSGVRHLTVGDRVMVLYDGLFKTKKVMHCRFAIRIPDGLSFDNAATMPIVYCTVVHAVVNKGELKKGQSILIHSACGGVGLAAIQVCQMLGAIIYATVGSEEKVQYLVENYGLAREHVFHSRNASFYDDVMRTTNGRGVDLVLNSLSGDLLHASWRCVAKWGKMMEIGKRDLLGRGLLALEMFNGNRTFYGIDLDSMFDNHEMFGGIMEQVLQYYADGHIQPIAPIRGFPAHKVSDAFRYMQKGSHIGKIVVTMPEDSKEIPSTVAPRDVVLSGSCTYLMVGGLSGLGKAVAAWMVERGARSFVFLSRSAGSSDQDKTFLAELRTQGCSAVAVAGSVLEMGDIASAMKAAPSPIAGLMQLSMVLKDLPLLKAGYDDWNTVQDPKVKGTWNLHNAFSGVKLDFFILFSSLSAVFGRPGQASYASANSFLGSFTQYRHGLGLPCSVVDIGAMVGVGTVSDRQKLQTQLTRNNVMMLQEDTLLDAIQVCIKRSDPKVCPNEFDETAVTCGRGYVSSGQVAIGMTSTTPLADPANRHPTRSDIRMGLAWHLGRQRELRHDSQGDRVRQLIDLIKSNPAMLNQASTLEQITMEIGRTFYSFMMLPEENLDVNMTLEKLGVDSLVGIEIRHWFRAVLGIEISVLEISNAGTIARLGTLVVASLKDKLGLPKQDGADNASVETPRQDLASQYSSYMSAMLKQHGALAQLPGATTSLPSRATIFLTGATGYLGTEILKELLRDDAIGVVIVLVRADTVPLGLDRVRRTAEISGWWTPAAESRVEVWLGDLSKARLGLEKSELLRLRGESTSQPSIDAIIHNGALVSPHADFNELRMANVESTIELLSCALASPTSPKFIYVSGGFKMEKNYTFAELADTLSTHVAYSQTKIMSERIVRDVASRMPPEQNRISVVKPGLIIGAADSGVTNVDDVLWHVVAAATSIKKFPEAVDEQWLYLSPVDKVAQKVTHQLFAAAGTDTFVDIVDGVALSKFWTLICEELSIPFASQLWDDWIEQVRMQLPDFVSEGGALSLLRQIVTDNSQALPGQQPEEAENMSEVQVAVQSSVRYLRRCGHLQTRLDDKRRMADNVIKRTGR